MTPTPDQIDSLRGAAERATPGPWFYRPLEFDDWGWVRGPPDRPDGPPMMVAIAGSGRYMADDEENQHRRDGTDPRGPNAEFIAAANPHVITALLDERAADKAEIERLREACTVFREYASSGNSFNYPLGGLQLLAAALSPKGQP